MSDFPKKNLIRSILLVRKCEALHC